jgi:hypothetical protein
MWNIKLWLLVCEVFSVSVLWHLQRFGMLVMHLWSEITLRSLRTNRLLYCPVAVWMFVRTLSERVCLRGLVGVRTLCVYLDLPLDASLPFWLQCIGQNSLGVFCISRKNGKPHHLLIPQLFSHIFVEKYNSQETTIKANWQTQPHTKQRGNIIKKTTPPNLAQAPFLSPLLLLTYFWKADYSWFVKPFKISKHNSQLLPYVQW